MHVRSTAASVARVSGLIALAAAASFVFSAAQAAPPPKKPAPAPHPVTRTAPAARTVTHAPVHTPTVNRTVTHNPTVTHTPNRTFTPNRTVTRTPNVTTHTGPTGPGTATFHRGPIGGGATPLHTPVAGVGPAGLRIGPHGPIGGPGGLHAGPARLPGAHPNFPVVHVGNRFFPINKGQRFIWWGGVRRTFVPLALLGTVLIGGAYWYPDAYVSITGPACGGLTPDGCELHWRDVDFVDGGGVPQCVQYCPWSGPPPAQVATLPPAPPIPQQGTCQMTIFADPNFGGVSAPTGDNQQNLSESGWQNAVSSIQVQSGTWDFFGENDYGGAPMELGPGSYPTLNADWDKKINSFMCVQPGPSA